MKWFLVGYVFSCASIAEADMTKCPSTQMRLEMPSKEVCYQIKALNGLTAECWAREKELNK